MEVTKKRGCSPWRVGVGIVGVSLLAVLAASAIGWTIGVATDEVSAYTRYASQFRGQSILETPKGEMLKLGEKDLAIRYTYYVPGSDPPQIGLGRQDGTYFFDLRQNPEGRGYGNVDLWPQMKIRKKLSVVSATTKAIRYVVR